jgi:RHS repeat-associated protein
MPDQLPEDGFVYFYHPDHLGSTAYVTDAAGDVYEHTGYFPHGETWIDQANSSEALPYLFTGKELDQETGLYYFGARYYDPQTALWQSADPALNDFLSDGRIGHPPRLSLYAYTWHNPLRLRDPDGRDTFGCGDPCFQSVALAEGAITLDHVTNSEVARGAGVLLGAAAVVVAHVAAVAPEAAFAASNIAVEAAGGTGVAVARSVAAGVALKAADKVADAGLADDAARAVRGVADDVAGQVAGMFGGGGKAAAEPSRAGFNGVQGPAQVTTRTTRGGERAARVRFPDTSVLDVSPKRVKEFVPSQHPNAPPGTMKRVGFGDAQPGSKGFKRDPMPADLEWTK